MNLTPLIWTTRVEGMLCADMAMHCMSTNMIMTCKLMMATADCALRMLCWDCLLLMQILFVTVEMIGTQCTFRILIRNGFPKNTALMSPAALS